MKQKIIIGFILLLLASCAGLFVVTGSKTLPIEHTTVSRATASFSYTGEAGKDALTILKSKTTVVQNKSGLVVGINGRVVDTTQHEYWAFYVNGAYASVGPASYVTKNTDSILWKIEIY